MNEEMVGMKDRFQGVEEEVSIMVAGCSESGGRGSKCWPHHFPHPVAWM